MKALKSYMRAAWATLAIASLICCSIPSPTYAAACNRDTDPLDPAFPWRCTMSAGEPIPAGCRGTLPNLVCENNPIQNGTTGPNGTVTGTSNPPPTPAPTPAPTPQSSLVTTCTGAGGRVPCLVYTPLEPIPGLATDQLGNSSFPRLVRTMFTIIIILTAAMAVISLTISGIMYMLAQVPGVKNAAKERLQAAIWGLLILLSSVLILNTINPQLTNFQGVLSPQGGGVPPPGVSTISNSNTITDDARTCAASCQSPKRCAQDGTGSWNCQ